MNEILDKAYNTVNAAILERGEINTDDVPPELLAYLREGLRDVDAEYVSDGNFPHPLPEFIGGLLVDEDRIYFEDYVDIRLPSEDFDAGDIPEVEYEDDPMLDTGPLSTRRKVRLDAMLKNFFGEKGSE